ncbi:MAG: hypothetical protein E5Y61_34135, partial [Mesorhizobium sp.]
MQIVVDDVSKHFAGAIALNNVTFEIRSGSIHGLVGEIYDGVGTSVSSPREAIERGIAVVQQELILCPELSVAANVYLGRETTKLGFLRSQANLREFNQLRDQLGFNLDGNAKVGSLSIA